MSLIQPVGFIPRAYQELIGDHILEVPRGAVWAGMGLGKTVATLTALDILLLCSGGPILVLAPLRVARTTWPHEVQKWSNLRHARVMPIVGNAKDRAAALNYKADIYTINYDNLVWLVEHFGDSWPFRIVVADESTRLKSFRLKQGGKRAQALGKVAHTKIDRFIELTGTPAPNGLIDLWGQMWFLDAGKRLGRTFTGFRDRWFQQSFDGYGSTPKANANDEINERIKDLCLTVKAEDWFDLEEPIVNNIYIDLPSKVRELYKGMEKDFFMQLGEHEVEAFNAASKSQKLLQIASGAAYVGEGIGANREWKELHTEKLDALEEIIEEANGASVMVAYHFKFDLARLKKRFPQGRELDSNPQTIADWNAGKIPILWAHPQSAGHGLNLQDGGNILAFYSHNWSLEDRLQILERIGPVRQLQAGHNRPVFIHNIIARETMDEIVMERIATKREVQDLLLDAMRRRG